MFFLRNLRPVLQIHLAVFLFGFTAIFGRLIQLNEGILVWYRMFLAFLSMALILLIRRDFRFYPLKTMFHLLFIGFILMIHWLTFYAAIKYSNISITLSCLASCPFFTSILEPLFTGRKLKWIELLLGIMAFLGIFLIFRFEQVYALGIILAVISAIFSAFFTVYSKLHVSKLPALSVSCFQIGFGFIFLSLLLPFYISYFNIDKLIPNFFDTIYLCLLSFVCTTIAYTLFIKALQKLSPFTINLTVNLEPVYGILLAFFIYQENKNLNGGFFIGTSIIFLTVLTHFLLENHKSEIIQ